MNSMRSHIRHHKNFAKKKKKTLGICTDETLKLEHQVQKPIYLDQHTIARHFAETLFYCKALSLISCTKMVM